MTDKEYNDCVRLHADALYRFMLRCLRHAEDARDQVQGAFEKLWARRQDVENNSVKSYLFTIAYHAVIDETRRKKRTEYRDVLDEQLKLERAFQPQLKKLLEQALDRLSERQRSLILLKDHEGYSYEEIAGITGLTAGQVKINLHRARLLVRQYLVSVENML